MLGQRRHATLQPASLKGLTWQSLCEEVCWHFGSLHALRGDDTVMRQLSDQAHGPGELHTPVMRAWLDTQGDTCRVVVEQRCGPPLHLTKLDEQIPHVLDVLGRCHHHQAL